MDGWEEGDEGEEVHFGRLYAVICAWGFWDRAVKIG